MPIEIFCCYAHKDQQLLEELKTHLIPLQHQGLITVWADTDIGAGVEWENEINKHLETADIVLLLVSPDFMNSEYCYSKEMKRAIERHDQEAARVIPIILRPVHWQGAPFGKLQALPTGAKPILSAGWYSLDEAFFSVVVGIRKAVEELAVQNNGDINTESHRIASLSHSSVQPRPAKVGNTIQIYRGHSGPVS